MTIEEAIDILTDNRVFTHACEYTEEEQGQALDMAIRSLEAWEKVKAEIEDKFGGCSICEWFEDYDYEENDISEYQSVGDISDIIKIIDKYKGDK